MKKTTNTTNTAATVKPATPSISAADSKALFGNLATLYNPNYTYHTQKGNKRKYTLTEKYVKENSKVPFLEAFFQDCLSLYKRLDANTRHHSEKSLRRVNTFVSSMAVRYNIGESSAIQTLVYNAYGNRVLSDKQREGTSDIMGTTGFSTFLKAFVVSATALYHDTLVYRESKVLIATIARAEKMEALQADVKKGLEMSKTKKTAATKAAAEKREKAASEKEGKIA